ncbi:hypothetical protein AUJ66_01440 [Candidatus Desantisbacteria bacterium CG1_02_38_46]|uniref:DUF5678 domain-containing protein n=3 Tax=unclassified Candidatus Desantisiibacteriota TaxID=3106372 RepID=A0A2H9PA72_9BACT|nr:MAG: hypothetical protein AUJ66_01440 [Candidatus Desantisbacteria bacterium CG1_02_38_46]PIU51089.1 MAG: hypothetical protein COS91_06330 [Candidatus Desantisbacteria bacterium CG07_land_8_20_14_0_80_39_15]PIZ15275.1 MAG: hypothetical protein COY51_05675 [Candidatus Desantisbacteria bacterium CG_4_10_14_0_8_um_filter_39_17]
MARKLILLKEAKKQLKNEWLAFVIKKELSEDEILGEVIAHNKDKRELHKNLRAKKVKDAYITFTGRYIKPGYEIMFNEN